MIQRARPGGLVRSVSFPCDRDTGRGTGRCWRDTGVPLRRPIAPVSCGLAGDGLRTGRHPHAAPVPAPPHDARLAPSVAMHAPSGEGGTPPLLRTRRCSGSRLRVTLLQTGSSHERDRQSVC